MAICLDETIVGLLRVAAEDHDSREAIGVRSDHGRSAVRLGALRIVLQAVAKVGRAGDVIDCHGFNASLIVLRISGCASMQSRMIMVVDGLKPSSTRREAPSRSGERVMASNHPSDAVRRSRAPGHCRFGWLIRTTSGFMALLHLDLR